MKKIIAGVLLLTVLSSSAVMCFATASSETVGQVSQSCCEKVAAKASEDVEQQIEELVLVQGNEIKEQGGYKKTKWNQLTKCDKKAVLKLLEASILCLDPDVSGWQKFRAWGLKAWLKIRGIDIKNLDVGSVELIVFDFESGELHVNWDAAK